MVSRAGSADFFELQDDARRASRRLVPVFLLALAAVAAAVALVFGALYALFLLYWGGPLPEGVTIDYDRLAASYLRLLVRGVPPAFYGWIAGGIFAVMLGASLWRLWQLRSGGEAVAEWLGALRIERNRATATETRLLNIVEEMAIASGVAVPPVYRLAEEPAINALAAGYAPNEAVIIVTQGALTRLTRDELQGVIAHEYSHILNGDIRLNVRLLGLLYGVAFIGQTGRTMLRAALSGAVRVRREKQTLEPFSLVVGLILAGVGHFGLLAARAIRAGIARERELLADAASVQFTRNPEGIAGALDSTLSLKLGTFVRNAHAEDVSHMFFGQGIGTALGRRFATHPPIDERIRRVHPRFLREDYRRRREGVHQQDAVAVVDGLGNVVKTLGGGTTPQGAALASAVALAAAVGQPSPAHVDAAARIAAAVPPATRRRLATGAGAEAVMFALALENDAAARVAELKVLGERRGEAFVRETIDAWGEIEKLGRAHTLPLVEIALPVLKTQPQTGRDAFVADLTAVIEADRRVTLGEFVLLTFLRQHLREGAGRPLPTRHRKVEDVAADAQLVLSLIAHAAGGEAGAAFARGAAVLEIETLALEPLDAISTRRVAEALERLRVLAPFQKPRLLKACVETVSADDSIRLAEAELVRMVAATLDCPLPPLLASLDPATLA